MVGVMPNNDRAKAEGSVDRGSGLQRDRHNFTFYMIA
jgi:hypothetical protein